MIDPLSGWMMRKKENGNLHVTAPAKSAGRQMGLPRHTAAEDMQAVESRQESETRMMCLGRRDMLVPELEMEPVTSRVPHDEGTPIAMPQMDASQSVVLAVGFAGKFEKLFVCETLAEMQSEVTWWHTVAGSFKVVYLEWYVADRAHCQVAHNNRMVLE